MARSLRARLLLASIAIAVTAVAATAWLTSRGTTDQLRGDVERTLETDSRIYERLWTYSTRHPDWDGVDDLVRELSEATGRRIALTTAKGAQIVDSARLEGREHVGLPSRPTAVVDPFNQVIISSLDPEGEGGEAAGPLYPLTPQEQADRTEAANAGSRCLDSAGFAHEVGTDKRGYPMVKLDDKVSDEPAAEAAFNRCVPVEALGAQSAGERAAIEKQDDLLSDCLERNQIALTTSTDSDGKRTVEIDKDDPTTQAGYARCEDESFRAVNDPLMADPARLYLGEPGGQAMTLLDAGGGRTLLAAAVVALLAIVVTAAVSRRMLRPVAQLTSAARRMEAGDLAARVATRGDDEIAGLAQAFNAMAARLATDEEQRHRLVTDVAHELRTPLANIRGYLEAAQDGVTAADAGFLASMHEEAVLLQRLVDDLQTLSLVEAGRLPLSKESVDVGGLAEQVALAHRARADAGDVALAVERTTTTSSMEIQADPERLRQALGNLVSNALRYTPPGGSVTIRVRREGALVVIDVIDTGSGIDAEHLPHLFDRFWRADPSRSRDTGGSGLGLAICSQLIERHGGSVTATSTVGEGSTFTIRLPTA